MTTDSAPLLEGIGLAALRGDRLIFSDIDFRRGADGEAQIIVDLTDPDIGINIAQQGEDVVIDVNAKGV